MPTSPGDFVCNLSNFDILTIKLEMAQFQSHRIEEYDPSLLIFKKIG